MTELSDIVKVITRTPVKRGGLKWGELRKEIDRVKAEDNLEDSSAPDVEDPNR